MTASEQERNDLFEKYKINETDWKDINLIQMKIKAQTAISLFYALNNTFAPHIDPDMNNLIDGTRDKLLKYLDDSFITEWQSKLNELQ